MTSHVSKKGWGASCRGDKTGGSYTEWETKYHISIQELKAENFGIMTVRKIFSIVKKLYLKRQYGSTFVCEEDKGTRNKILSKLTKGIWDYLLQNRITITVVSLPVVLN